MLTIYIENQSLNWDIINSADRIGGMIEQVSHTLISWHDLSWRELGKALRLVYKTWGEVNVKVAREKQISPYYVESVSSKDIHITRETHEHKVRRIRRNVIMKEKFTKTVCTTRRKTTLQVGGFYYIDETCPVSSRDGLEYVDVYTPSLEWIGMAPRRAFSAIKNEKQTREILRELRGMYPNMETLYEDVIIASVGEEGLYNLRKHHMVETCGMFEGRKLYAI